MQGMSPLGALALFLLFASFIAWLGGDWKLALFLLASALVCGYLGRRRP